jgi:pimeloyl-ACP methyl ester carboxylesterase
MLFANVNGRQLEYRMIPGDALAQPTLVFLHEGLGSVAMWRDFPDKLAARLGARALVYSRFGYGRSDRLTGPRTPAFMHEEALQVLPPLLDLLGIERPLLVGHSDGASIALIHAGVAGRPVHGLALMAPHVFVEPGGLESIARIRKTYGASDELKTRLARYHADVDGAFLGWANIWLAPEFRSWSIEDVLGGIDAPALLIQGEDDEYGTMAHIESIEAHAQGPTSRLVLPACGHSPHRDQEAAVLDAMTTFVRAL